MAKIGVITLGVAVRSKCDKRNRSLTSTIFDKRAGAFEVPTSRKGLKS